MTLTLPMAERTGTCQPERCNAACCRFLILDVNPIYLTDPDAAAWVGLHGIELAEHDGRVLARIPLACLMLAPTGDCLLYGTPERPALCEAFPQTPASLTGIEDLCTFGFKIGPDPAVTG